MSRGGKRNETDGPERKCIVTGEVSPKDGLIRFVVGPDDVIFPDVLGKLPGRGMYVSATRDAVAQAGRSHFSRSAKQPVKVPEDLLADIERQLVRRVTDLLAMARKAGRAVCGFEKVKAWLGNDQVRVLLQASDGSERGKTNFGRRRALVISDA